MGESAKVYGTFYCLLCRQKTQEYIFLNFRIFECGGIPPRKILSKLSGKSNYTSLTNMKTFP